MKKIIDNRYELVFFVSFIIVALFLRFFLISGGDYGSDEKHIMLERHDAMMKSFKSFFFVPTVDEWEKDVGYDYNGFHVNYGMQSATTPLSWQMISFSVLFFGENAFGLRFIPALFGFMYVVAFYFLIRHVYGKKYAIISAALLSLFPFSISNVQNGAILEPVTIFLFIMCLLSLARFFGEKWRYSWVIWAMLMVFSNFPKAIIMLGMLFIWETFNLFYKKEFDMKSFIEVCIWYAVAFVPSLIWAFAREVMYSLKPFWFLLHPFERGVEVPFRIIEVLYSYGSTKQAALLVIPSIYGLFLLLNKIRNSDLKTENLDRLWALMFVFVPLLLIIAKQSGPYTHSMIGVAMVMLTTHAIVHIYDKVKFGNLFSFATLLLFTLGYIILVSNMGYVIPEVPRYDSEAFELYKSVLLSIIGGVYFLIPLLMVFLVCGFLYYAHFNLRKSLSRKLAYSLSCVLFLSYAVYASVLFI